MKSLRKIIITSDTNDLSYIKYEENCHKYKIPKGINLLKNLKKIEIHEYLYYKIKKDIKKLKKINYEMKIEFLNKRKIRLMNY